MTSAAQLQAIHRLKSRAGLAEDEFRALLAHHTGKTSSKDLSGPVAGRFIDVLKGHAGQRSADDRPRADRATGKYAPVLQALWLSAWHLGLTRSKDDAALLAFVTRQTGLAHTRFLADHAAANRAIEGLKAWIARDGGVTWPADPQDGTARKAAVVHAIARRLVAAGGFTPFLAEKDPWPVDFEAYGYSHGLPASFTGYADADWVTLMGWLGARLRAVLAKGKPKGGVHG